MRSMATGLLTLAALAVLTTPALAQSGTFGNAVLIGQDELIVSEPTTSFRPGSVYVYRKVGGEWREAAQLQAGSPERADGFGTVLALAGNTLVVGQREGPLHTFERDGSGWRPSGTIAGTEDIGVRRAEADDSDWGQVYEIPLGCNQFGYCDADFRIALAGEGEWLLVGDPRGSSEAGGGYAAAMAAAAIEGGGAVHAFRRGPDGSWSRQAVLQPEGGTPDDRFGTAIAIRDGRALIGAPEHTVVEGDGGGEIERSGRVYEFVLDGDGWRETGSIDPRPEQDAEFGADIAMSDDRAVIGAPGSGDGYGAAYYYTLDESGDSWSLESRLTAFSARRGDRFGAAVGMEGSDVWVGAPAPWGIATGEVHVYRADLDEELVEAPRRIRLEETVTRDGFGGRISTGAGIATVSALGMDHGAGSVHVYERDAGGAWQDAGKLVSAPDALAALTGEERECEEGSVGPFECDEVDLLAFIPISGLRAPEHSRGIRTNDNWGWTDPDTGHEYAIVGRNDGTSFLDITDPVNPVLVADIPKTPDTPPSQLWRDIKTYGYFAYIVADGAGDHGMQVFDLRRLRDIQDPPALMEPDLLYRGEGSTRVGSIHNIAINEETGFAYLTGGGCGGMHMVDIREPLEPIFAGCADPGATHDMECLVYQGPDERYQGSEICLRSGGQRFIVSDVTDKANPVQLANVSHPNPAYMHQGWTTDDHRYHLMNDEADVIRGFAETTRTLVWDLSDLEDPSLALEFMGSLPASAHNLYIEDGLMYQANYRYGLHVIDISDPLDPQEVGFFNTTPYLSGPGFSGAWSNYPFFESGTVIVTSLQEGLFVLRKRDATVIF